MSSISSLVIGTRGSKLALVQTDMVRAGLQQVAPGIAIELQRISTKGDRIQDRPLSQVGGKALFVEEIEAALREKRIQLAVHSAKDIPSDLPDDMRISAYLPRADAHDVLISRVSDSIATLPPGARVGTSSPRRACQLRALRSDIELKDIRGNVDTRLAKLESGEFDAIILAAAGLSRLGLMHHATQIVPFELMLPCGAQGAIAIEVSANDTETLAIVARLNHEPTSRAVTCERAFLSVIGGTCDTPLAAHAVVDDGQVTLTAMVGDSHGRIMQATLSGASSHAAQIGAQLADAMMSSGGAALLRADGNDVRWSGVEA